MIQYIAVVGAGTMGSGIAHIFAQYNYNVNIIDTNETVLNKAIDSISINLDRQIKKELLTEEDKLRTLKNITSYSSMEKGVSEVQLVIEAVSENLLTKKDIFMKLDSLCSTDTILASNTSSISITQLASSTNRPDKVIGMHFMNPVPIMKLVEIIQGFHTSGQTTSAIKDLVLKIQKVPVQVNDFPGFIANRLLMPLINEAIYSLFEHTAGVEEIDTIMRLGMGHPMGPLELADFIGLDICLSIMKVLYNGFLNPKYAPCPLLVNMVEGGLKGVKSGEGFYVYTQGSKNKFVNTKFVNSTNRN